MNLAIIPNFLKLPPAAFKLKEIETGNQIFFALFEGNLGGYYQKKEGKIVVLSSQNLSKIELQKLLYKRNFAQKYEGIYPLIDQRNSKGNWMLALTKIKPAVAPYILPTGYLNKVLGYSLWDDAKATKKVFLTKLNFPQEELDFMQQEIGDRLVANVMEVMTPKKDGSGIWLWNNYKEEFGKETSFTPHQCAGGYLNEAYFTKINHYTFELKPFTVPSEAISAIFSGPSFLDCGSVVTACFYKTLLEIVGENKFDAFFTTQGKINLQITIAPTFQNNLMSYFTRFSKEAKHQGEGEINQRPLKRGDMCSFLGVKYYSHKFPKGSSGSWNTIYAGRNQQGDQEFVAQNFPRPLTEKDIQHLFVDKYNRAQKKWSRTRSLLHAKELYEQPWIQSFLSKYPEIAEEDLQKHGFGYFLDGYLHTYTRRLEAKYILALLYTEDIEGLKKELHLRYLFFSFGVFDAIKRTH